MPPAALPDPPPWREFAFCRGADPEVFFPAHATDPQHPDRRSRGSIEDERAALAFCVQCPVREPCAEHAIRYELYGVWGGLNEAARVRIRRRRGITIPSRDIDVGLYRVPDFDGYEETA